jgi:hypothetical protein
MSRQLRLLAAVAVVLVAISGFSPARKGGGHRSSGKSGGCSSSTSSSHNSSGSSYDSGSKKSGYGSSGSGYGSGSRRYHSTTGTTGPNHQSGSGSATGIVTQCAARSGGEAKAVVEVRNPKGYSKTYRVRAEFLDASGLRLDSGSAHVEVGSRTTGLVDVPMAHPKRIGDVSECRVTSVS